MILADGAVVTGRTIPVDWGALEDAFEADGRRATYYVNLCTGEVLRFDVESGPPLLVERARYAKIPSPTAAEQYKWLEEFTLSVTDPDLRPRLTEAISGPRAFRHFKDELVLYAEERSRWWRFRKERVSAAMDAWLLAAGITPLVARHERYNAANPPAEDCSAPRLRQQLATLVDGTAPGELRFLISLAEFLGARAARSRR